MKQLKHKTVMGASVVGAGLAGLSSTAHADNFIYNNSNQGSNVEISGSTTASDSINRLAYDNYVSQLRGRYSWIKVDNETVGNPKDTLNKLKELEPTFQKIERLKNEVSQARAELAKRGINPTVSNDRATLDNLTSKVKNFETAVSELNDAIRNSSSIATDNTLERMVADANAEIAKAAETTNHYEDGILGNLDKIHRKAQDSSKVGTITSTDGNKSGVIVDVTETGKVNVVETQNDVQTDILVRNVGDLAAKRQEALRAIATNVTNNENQVLKAGVYKDNAVRNIDNINEWLQKEQDRADHVQDEIEKNMTAAKSLEEMRNKALAELDEAEQLIKTSGKSQKTIEKALKTIEEARATLAQSGITQNKTLSINEADNVDFGDIGRDESVIKAIAKKVTDSIDGKVDQALEKLRRDNAAAQVKVDAWKSEVKTNMDKYMEKVRAGKIAGQVDEEWLRTRPIYQTNSGGYQSFVKNALSLTEEDTEGVLTKHGNLWITNGTHPTPKVAAALYNEKSKQGLDEGFGSVMLPSANVNDFVTVEGRKLASSQSFAGGASGILDALIKSSKGMKGTGGKGMADLPVLKDIKAQHIDEVGNDKVLLVVSDKPDATFKLKNSFLYIDDASGEPKTTDMTVKLSIRDGSGNELGEKKVNGGRTHTKYFYYMSVDAAVGKLVVGGGYINVYDQSANKGNHNTGSNSGTSELALGADSDSSDSGTLQEWLRSQEYFFPTVPDGNPYIGAGLGLTVDVKVNPIAGKFAENSPLYIADIDDRQKVETSGDVVINSASAPTYQGEGVVTTSAESVSAHNHNVDLDDKSIMTTANGPVTVSRIVSGKSYEGIDLALFSPWGVIGAQPKLKLPTVSHTVETFDIDDPSARAHTTGKYAVTKLARGLKTKQDPDVGRATLPNLSVSVPINVPDRATVTNKVGAYATSIVVRQLADDIKRAGSGNSLIWRYGDTSQKLAGSGNTLVIRDKSESKKAGSGNSLVWRYGDALQKLAGSGNTLVIRDSKSVYVPENESPMSTNPNVRVIQGLLKEQNKIDTDGNISAVLKRISSPIVINKDAVTLDVYVDPSLSDAVKDAINDWQKALSEHGIELKITHDKGRGLAILDSDDVTTRAGRTLESKDVQNDSMFEMKGLAGLTTITQKVGIINLDSDDKLNKNGTFTVSDLRNTKMVVQINSESVKDHNDLVKVIKHELGHVFGLQHSDKDPLMTTYYSDTIFTGTITPETASAVAQNIRGGNLCECGICLGSKA